MSPTRIPSPCIGLCSTTYGDPVCRGCQRFHNEIIQWNQYKPEHKTLVWQRIECITETVLARTLRIQDPAKLEEFLIKQQIRYVKTASANHWVLSLLKALSQSRQLSEHNASTFLQQHCGIRCFTSANTPLKRLWNDIKNQLLVLSEAQYELQNRSLQKI